MLDFVIHILFSESNSSPLEPPEGVLKFIIYVGIQIRHQMSSADSESTARIGMIVRE